jgi:hypothetical protein
MRATFLGLAAFFFFNASAQNKTVRAFFLVVAHQVDKLTLPPLFPLHVRPLLRPRLSPFLLPL